MCAHSRMPYATWSPVTSSTDKPQSHVDLLYNRWYIFNTSAPIIENSHRSQSPMTNFLTSCSINKMVVPSVRIPINSRSSPVSVPSFLLQVHPSKAVLARRLGSAISKRVGHRRIGFAKSSGAILQSQHNAQSNLACRFDLSVSSSCELTTYQRPKDTPSACVRHADRTIIHFLRQ